MNKLFFITLTLISIIQLSLSKKELEILEDFSVDIDYRLESSNSDWKKRGVINFIHKSNKSQKTGATLINEPLTQEMIEEIKSECQHKDNGLYILRFKSEKSVLYSSINSCELQGSQFRDKFMVSHNGQIKSDGLVSINYDTDIRQEKKTKSNFVSSIEFIPNIPAPLPIFPEEKEAGKPPVPEPGFIQKYWWVFLIVILLSSLGGGQQAETAAA
jgi:hypothetical protein